MSVNNWKVIKPDALKIDAMIRELEKPVIETINEADKEFAKTYSTWDHKPKFIKKLKVSKVRIIGSTTTTEKGSSNNPYPFVTRGTKVRRALMSVDFSPKTKPRVLGSSGGRGGVVYISKKLKRPGIKAREFEDVVMKLEQPKFEQRAKKALQRARRVSGQQL